MAVSIDGQRLWDSLMAMAEIGPTENGGSCRLALTPEDAAGRRLLLDWCESLGCTWRVDRVGNLFIRRAGKRDDLEPVAMGSHLDTQPKGGRFDGILGVLAGLEVFRTLADQGIVTERPLELVVWTNEEGSRFAPAMVASGTYAGAFSVDSTLAREDRDGVTFGEALEACGYAGESPVGEPRLDSFFELHIEQGPVLEEEDEIIGVVTGVQGMRWFDVTFSGQSAHAGPTPMRYRRDALAAAARLIDRLQAHALADESGDTKVTCGCLDIVSASRNVVPGEVKLTIDLRHVMECELDALQERFERLLTESGETFGVTASQERIWASPVVEFAPECVATVERATRERELPYRRMMSGAGHDAVYVSRVAPTAMIFIPCRDGISHNEAEYATPEHCAAGTQVLCDAILERANRVY
ncbi:Zn-dependent hydrolase [Chromohalobacter canadensis]|uniref:Zn-dependent hydrolase n=1 Tax=Chromohalobacter canadensis TaxID=141389 RepID=UPI0021BFFA82|nr:Zn-dependent hydrolase [Chromohalobacter canadensis]MCT8467641.1 Zn-dependent hydrolase [Chromohalobacter canadensis]MCT8470611.1 Zn-dependent hydrolase [Chromohalobacter canadensis]MCT8498138.1 Zn-dependent hydrolase [Chromohalobacter canadensis]